MRDDYDDGYGDAQNDLSSHPTGKFHTILLVRMWSNSQLQVHTPRLMTFEELTDWLENEGNRYPGFELAGVQ